jgi:hypothetical protein
MIISGRDRLYKNLETFCKPRGLLSCRQSGDGQLNVPNDGVPPRSVPGDEGVRTLAGGNRGLQGELHGNLRDIKHQAGLSADSDTRIDPETGDVYDAGNGDYNGNVWGG